MTSAQKHVFIDMNEYMLCKKNVDNWSKHNNSTCIKLNKSNKESIMVNTNANATLDCKKSSHIIYPEEKDKLFWCFYIAYKGIDAYNFNKKDFFKIKNNIKIKAIELLREKKSILKQFKIKRSHTEANLISDTLINTLTLQALCLAYNINLRYIVDKCYHNFLFGKNKLVVIENKNNDTIFIDILPSIDKIKKQEQNYFLLENIEKPLFALSKYTLGDLHNICGKLLIPIRDAKQKKYTRKQLYDEIVAFIS